MKGEHTRRLSSVRSTATPASTLPTVSETSMMLNWKSSVVVMMPRSCFGPAGILPGISAFAERGCH